MNIEIESSYGPKTCVDSSDNDDNKLPNDQASLLLGSCASHQAIMSTACFGFCFGCIWVTLGP